MTGAEQMLQDILVKRPISAIIVYVTPDGMFFAYNYENLNQLARMQAEVNIAVTDELRKGRSKPEEVLRKEENA